MGWIIFAGGRKTADQRVRCHAIPILISFLKTLVFQISRCNELKELSSSERSYVMTILREPDHQNLGPWALKNFLTLILDHHILRKSNVPVVSVRT